MKSPTTPAKLLQSRVDPELSRTSTISARISTQGVVVGVVVAVVVVGLVVVVDGHLVAGDSKPHG